MITSVVRDVLLVAAAARKLGRCTKQLGWFEPAPLDSAPEFVWAEPLLWRPLYGDRDL